MRNKNEKERVVTDVGDPDFDWDSLEKATGSRLVENQKVNTYGDNVKVYCHEDYAQELYDMMRDHHPGPSLNIDDQITGRIKRMDDEVVELDCGLGYPIFLDTKKEHRPYMEEVAVGDEIDVKVKRVDHPDFGVMGRYTDLINARKEEVLRDSIGGDKAFRAYIEDLVSGGFMCRIDGVSAFLPGSLAGMNKLYDFESCVGKTLNVVPVNYSPDWGCVVVSHRDYLLTLVPDRIKEIDIGQYFEGIVTGSVDFGVFVEFKDCLTGLVHKDDLSEKWKDRFKRRVIDPQETIGFYIKEITKVKGKDRIVLTQRKENLEGSSGNGSLEELKKNVTVPQEIKAEVIESRNYGLILDLGHGSRGVLHKNSMEGSPRDFEKGDTVPVLINHIDVEKGDVDMRMA